MKTPCARRNDILLEKLVAETMVYDKTNHRAHVLNQTVALVWESADGRNSIDDIAQILHRELGSLPIAALCCLPRTSWANRDRCRSLCRQKLDLIGRRGGRWRSGWAWH